MPKILRIINRFNLGGPTYNVAYLTKYMPSDFETLLIGGSNEITEESSMYIIDKFGLNPIIIPEMQRALNTKNDLLAYQKINQIIKEFKPDIVHTHASKAGALGRFCAKINKVPIIVHTFHGHVFDSYFNSNKANVFINMERLLAKMSTKIIAISDIQKQDLACKYHICNPDKIAVINLGFDLNCFFENQEEKRQQFRTFYGLADDEIAIAITGRVVPVKNHTMFILAIKHVLEHTQKKIKVFVIGDGENMENLKDQINKCGLSWVYKPQGKTNAVFSLLSWQKNIDVVNAGVDIIALTSLNEGTPVSLIEAQASSKPIVTTNVGGVSDIVIPNETALLVESNHSIEFGDKLLELIESEEKRQQLSQKGLEFVLNKFHYSRLVKDMSNLYYELINNKK